MIREGRQRPVLPAARTPRASALPEAVHSRRQSVWSVPCPACCAHVAWLCIVRGSAFEKKASLICVLSCLLHAGCPCDLEDPTEKTKISLISGERSRRRHPAPGKKGSQCWRRAARL